MSSRARLPAPAASRRTRRGEGLTQPPPAALAEGGPNIVSNPIFRYEAAGVSLPKSPGDAALRCVYRPNSLYALVHDPAAAAAANGGNGVGKPLPLPLPPCRAQQRSGSHVPASRSGPVLVSGSPHGSRVLLRKAPHDPFLAAYVACSKGGGGGGGGGGLDGAEADRPQQKRKQGKKKKKKKEATKKKGEDMVRGCGVWSGWAAAGAKYAGAMSCRHGCAVAEHQREDAPAAVAKAEAGEDAHAGLTLDLSWAPAVLSARALERRREQR